MLSTQTPSEVSNESSDDQISEQDQYLLPLVDPDSLEPIFNYVTALNLALTGDLSKLKASAAFGCGSDITKIDKKTGAKVLWSASKITNQFIVQQRGFGWQLIDTK